MQARRYWSDIFEVLKGQQNKTTTTQQNPQKPVNPEFNTRRNMSHN